MSSKENKRTNMTWEKLELWYQVRLCVCVSREFLSGSQPPSLQTTNYKTIYNITILLHLILHKKKPIKLRWI